MDFKDRVVLITGAAQGIGKGTASAFAGSGAVLVLNDVNQDRLHHTAREISSTGVTCMAIPADVSISSCVDELFQQVTNQYGKLDVLVNNAGITRDNFLHKMTEEQWNQVINVNLKGPFLCLQGAGRIMRVQRSGSIINISSDARFGNVGQANYVAAKAGLVGLTRTAALELARYNVRVNAISPGVIDTEMLRAVPEKTLAEFMSRVPMGRMGTIEELSNLILFLASDQASYITGQAINCDGGWYMR